MGNCTVTYENGGASTTVFYNPFRFRGYYYDSETGLYYLNSRYYDPAIGRFINADVYVTTGQGLVSYNMFAYCLNAPISNKDDQGTDTVCATKDDEVGPVREDELTGGSSNGGGGGGGNSYMSFKTPEHLNDHFAKHGKEFGNTYKNSQEYLEGTNYVVNNGTYVPEMNGYLRFYGANGRANYAFVGMNSTHSFITTFHLCSVKNLFLVSWLSY